jgi:hypothetical protein
MGILIFSSFRFETNYMNFRLWHCAPWNRSNAHGGKELILMTYDFVLPNQSLVYSLIIWFTNCLTTPKAFRCCDFYLKSRDENGMDIFRPYSRPNPFRGVLIPPYPSPDI